MIKSLSMCSLLPVALIFVTCSFVSLAQQLTCQSNGCDGCCVTSDSCSIEHTLVSEDHQCHSSDSLPSFETPLIPGLELCPYDIFTLEYGQCFNSRVDDPAKSVGDYGKPNWVGAEFQSVAYDTFSMTVMWEHRDAEILSSFPDLSPVQGYEIRIYEKEAGRSEILQNCFCVTDPNLRNISDIHSVSFTYNEISHMIVEVRTFPSLIGEDERNRRRNCSLLSGCVTTNTTEECSNSCYSWPQSCLDFLPLHNPETCPPPLYGPPVNVKAEISMVNDSVTSNRGIIGQLSLSWEPPRMNYELFPVPSTYYVTIENEHSAYSHTFKVVGMTKITVSPLNITSVYAVFISAYVPCSGLSSGLSQYPQYYSTETSGAGCGNRTTLNTYPQGCEDPTSPLHGWLGDYYTTLLHSTVTYQCESGWTPSELFTATCTSTDRLDWVPDPANHTCSDIDECLEGSHNCSEYANCENNHGGFNCKCITGYEGDGVMCEISSAVIIGTSTVIGLVVAIALLNLIVIGSIFLARRVRIRLIFKQTSK